MTSQLNESRLSVNSSSNSVLANRPRGRRVNSNADPGNSADRWADASHHSSPFLSPFNSRSPSPTPYRHKYRIGQKGSQSQILSQGTSSSVGGAEPGSADGVSDLWGTSWIAIQGVATSVLGPRLSGKTSKQKHSLLGSERTRIPAKSVPSEWGPSTIKECDVGVGSQAERDLSLRTRKRKELLNGDSNMLHGSLMHKRRISDERLSVSALPDESDERETPAYVYYVRPDDTVAGISIKFNCQVATIRKANRMWPNDVVQSRKTVIIPLHACAVKGRVVTNYRPDDSKIETHLSSHGVNGSTATNGLQGSIISNPRTIHEKEVPGTPGPSSQSPSEDFGRHDSWVVLPYSETPVEIVRVPRRSLSYFPPARRKSVTLSDASAITPRASFDLPLPKNTPPPSVSTSQTLSAGASPLGRSTSPSLLHTQSPTARVKRDSTRQIQRSKFSASLSGPGGVGTMGGDVTVPGPAHDGLNKIFAPHLPNVAPPPNSEFVPWVTEDASFIGPVDQSRIAYDRTKIDFDNVGGAIEGWVRKVAARASKAASAITEAGSIGSETERNRNGQAESTESHYATGDLIELMDSFTIDDDDERDIHVDGGEGESMAKIHRNEADVSHGSGFTMGTDGVRGRGRKDILSVGKAGKGD